MKSVSLWKINKREKSRPVRGAWIEMWERMLQALSADVAPRKGRVD